LISIIDTNQIVSTEIRDDIYALCLKSSVIMSDGNGAGNINICHFDAENYVL